MASRPTLQERFREMRKSDGSSFPQPGVDGPATPESVAADSGDSSARAATRKSGDCGCGKRRQAAATTAKPGKPKVGK